MEAEPKVDESESAFPFEFVDKSNTEWDGQQIVNFGMTLRDYFAAKAMQALLSSPEMVAFVGKMASENGLKDRAGVLAATAYDFADAMLEIRQS